MITHRNSFHNRNCEKSNYKFSGTNGTTCVRKNIHNITHIPRQFWYRSILGLMKCGHLQQNEKLRGQLIFLTFFLAPPKTLISLHVIVIISYFTNAYVRICAFVYIVYNIIYKLTLYMNIIPPLLLYLLFLYLISSKT